VLLENGGDMSVLVSGPFITGGGGGRCKRTGLGGGWKCGSLGGGTLVSIMVAREGIA